jgi:hypothetical protein
MPVDGEEAPAPKRAKKEVKKKGATAPAPKQDRYVPMPVAHIVTLLCLNRNDLYASGYVMAVQAVGGESSVVCHLREVSVHADGLAE